MIEIIMHIDVQFTSRKQKIKAYFQLNNSMTVMLPITTDNTLLSITCSENPWGNILRRVENLKGAGWMFVKALILTKMYVIWALKLSETSVTQPHFQTLPTQTHQIHSWSFMISLIEFPQLERDPGHKNVYCWCASRNRFGKNWSE